MYILSIHVCDNMYLSFIMQCDRSVYVLCVMRSNNDRLSLNSQDLFSQHKTQVRVDNLLMMDDPPSVHRFNTSKNSLNTMTVGRTYMYLEYRNQRPDLKLKYANSRRQTIVGPRSLRTTVIPLFNRRKKRRIQLNQSWCPDISNSFKN